MAKKAQMTVEEFAEKYNRVMDWNRDILNTLDSTITSGSKYMQHIIEDYLDTDKITPETCDFSSYDISDFEVEIDGQGTIDEITYIPSKDELGFVIYRYDSPSEVFMSRNFKRGDVDLVYRIFNILYNL